MTPHSAASKLAEHVCPVCGAFARTWTVPPEDGWTVTMLECSVCPARAAIRLPVANTIAPSEANELARAQHGHALICAFIRHGLPCDCNDAPTPAPDHAALETAARVVLETFERDEAQGYRSRDRQFAIELLKPALAALRGATPAGWPPATPPRDAPAGFRWVKECRMNAAGQSDVGWYLHRIPEATE